jgi:hypothetical protein
MLTTARRRPRHVHYPETDHRGEHELQRFIAELLRPLIERWLASRGVVAHAGADTFVYWVEGDPTQRVAPDVYVIDGVAQSLEEPSWKVWELAEIGARLSLGFEIVSGDWAKDYDDVPVSYSTLGAKELVIFDPAAREGRDKRYLWQVYRRVRGRGLIRVEVSQRDRVRSKTLGCWLRAVDLDGRVRVRLAEGDDGELLFPTEAEAQAARADEQAARADEQAARAEQAEAELARLRREIEALRKR